MKFKKIILLLGLTVALTVATACGSKGTDADTNGGQTTDQEATCRMRTPRSMRTLA